MENILYICEYNDFFWKPFFIFFHIRQIIRKEKLFTNKEHALQFLRYRKTHYPDLECFIKTYHFNSLTKEFDQWPGILSWNVLDNRVMTLK